MTMISVSTERALVKARRILNHWLLEMNKQAGESCPNCYPFGDRGEKMRDQAARELSEFLIYEGINPKELKDKSGRAYLDFFRSNWNWNNCFRAEELIQQLGELLEKHPHPLR